MGRNPVEVAEKGASVITPSQNPGKRAKCPAWVVPLFDVELGDHIVKHFRDVMGQRRAATVLLATGYLRSKQRHWPVKFWAAFEPAQRLIRSTLVQLGLFGCPIPITFGHFGQLLGAGHSCMGSLVGEGVDPPPSTRRGSSAPVQPWGGGG